MNRDQNHLVKSFIRLFDKRYAQEGAFVAELRGDARVGYTVPMIRATRLGLNVLGLKLGVSQHEGADPHTKLHVFREVDYQEWLSRGGVPDGLRLQ